MNYYFGDHLRLQLFWATPNLCAGVLLLLFFLSLGFFLYFNSFSGKKGRILCLSGLLVVVAIEVLLGMTYSRGGFVALGSGLVFFWYFTRNRWPLIMLGTFFISLLLIPQGWLRAETIGNAADGSIYNRLLIWRGALCILADHWLTGAGSTQIGEIYTVCYQPLWLNERYSTMVGDYFTIGAAWGILVLALYLMVVFSSVWLAIIAWRKTKNIFFLTMGTGVVGYQLASCFSTFYCHWSVFGPFCIFVLALALMLFSWTRISDFKVTVRDFGVPAIAAGAVCIIFLLVSWALREGQSFDNQRFQLVGEEEKPATVWHCVPRSEPRAKVIYYYDVESSHDRELSRSMIRLLLEQQYEVWAAPVDSGRNGLSLAQKVYQKVVEQEGDQSIFLFGTENGGKHAILTAVQKTTSSLQGVIALDAPGEWPFDELSPVKHVAELQVPLLLINTGENDSIEHELLKIRKKYEDSGRTVAWVTLAAVADQKGLRYMNIIHHINTFIKSCNGKRK